MAAREWVTKAELSRRTGVSTAGITKACQGKLADAVEGAGKKGRVDLRHPLVAAYLVKHAEPPPPPVDGRSNPKHRAGPGAARDKMKAGARGQLPVDQNDEDFWAKIPPDIRALGNKSLRQLVDLFGTDQRFLDWLSATKAIEDIHTKRLKNAHSEGELVARELVKLAIIEPVETMHIKLLTDGAKTIAKRVMAIHGAGGNFVKCEKEVQEQIESFIRPLKTQMGRVVKKMEG